MSLDATRALWVMLTARFPQAFPLDACLIRPLKIGIHLDILAAIPEADPLLLRRVLSRWCNRPVYLWTLAHGGARVDLHGQPAGEVTKEQQAHARERLKAIAEKRRQEAATKPVETSKAAIPAPAPEPDPPPVQAPIRPILKLRKAPGEDDQCEREGGDHA
jgi:ProP effector